jgi:hypothetical protein
VRATPATVERMSETVTTVLYRGHLTQRDHGEAMDVLFLGDGEGRDPFADEPLARRIADDMGAHGSYLSVRYWTSDAEMTDDGLRECAVRALFGDGEGTRYSAHYSEVTGYLWTDEDIMVGGHDLLAELESHLGRWCLLEIGYSREPGPA